MSPNIIAQLTLLGYTPVVLVLFALLPLRIAILTGMIGGWLFLPMITIPITGIPDYDKVVAANCAVGLGCLIFAHRQLFSLRFNWVDLPMLLWCLAPSFSSLANGLGAYDACSVGLRQILAWLLPYCIGRVYFRDTHSLKQLATAIIIGGLVYMPLCLLEIRLSPQLNAWVYGFYQSQFCRNLRFDGFRPIVFMRTGLMVGVWMGTATVVAFWLGISGVKKILHVSYVWIFVALFVTTVLCKSLYAILLMLAGISLLTIARYGKTLIPAILLLLLIPTYMLLRGTQVVSAKTITHHAENMFGRDRAQSLDARLSQEDLMIQHAMQRPVFGWGGWMRSWPIDSYTGEYQIRGLDGLWTITIGENGLYGVVLLFATLLTPVATNLFCGNPRTWGSSETCAYEVLSICLLLFASDCLLNGMFNPIFVIIAGAIASRSPEYATDIQVESQVVNRHNVSVRRDRHRINGTVATKLSPQKP